MNADLAAIVSAVSRQFPDFAKEDYPKLIAFLKAYYQFLNNKEFGYLIDPLKDIDATVDPLLVEFKKNFAKNIPELQYLKNKEFLRNAKQFYTNRGNEDSFKFLFKGAYGKDLEIKYPSKQMLKASAGKWNQEVSVLIEVVTGSISAVTPGSSLLVKGTTGDISLVVTKVVKKTDLATTPTDLNTYEIFFKNTYLPGLKPGNRVYLNFNSGTQTYGFIASILPTVSGIKIIKPGAGFKFGQTFSINSGSGQDLEVRISAVDLNSGIQTIEPVNFGYGYTGSFFSSISPNDTVMVDDTIANELIGVTENTRLLKYTASNAYFEQTGPEQDWYNTELYSLVSGLTSNTLPTVANVSSVNDSGDYATLQIRIGGYSKYPGSYEDTSGFLSDSIRTQDNFYYQDFSYVLISDVPKDQYGPLVNSLLHPAGNILFGEFSQITEYDLAAEIDLIVQEPESLIEKDAYVPPDSVYLSDSFTKTATFVRPYSDTSLVTDVLTKTTTTNKADTVTVSENFNTTFTYGPDYAQDSVAVSANWSENSYSVGDAT